MKLKKILALAEVFYKECAKLSIPGMGWGIDSPDEKDEPLFPQKPLDLKPSPSVTYTVASVINEKLLYLVKEIDTVISSMKHFQSKSNHLVMVSHSLDNLKKAIESVYVIYNEVPLNPINLKEAILFLEESTSSIEYVKSIIGNSFALRTLELDLGDTLGLLNQVSTRL